MSFRIFLESHYKTLKTDSGKSVEIFKNPDPSEIRMFIKNINDEYRTLGRTPDRYSLKIFVDEKDYYVISTESSIYHKAISKAVPEFLHTIWCYLDISKNLQDATLDWSGDYKEFKPYQREILQNHPILNKQFKIRVREY